jgi:hypothetical protein
MRKQLVYFLFILFAFACEDQFCCINPEDDIVDTWVLFERGYSPGAGYIVEPINETPAQTMVLRSNGRFSSNIEDLKKYHHFAILPDQDHQVLALFEKKPPMTLNLDEVDHSYMIEFQENGTVNLYYRFCFEGCHLGLRRLSN